MSIQVNEILLTFTTAVEITKAGMQLLLKYIFKGELLFQSLNAAFFFFFKARNSQKLYVKGNIFYSPYESHFEDSIHRYS